MDGGYRMKVMEKLKNAFNGALTGSCLVLINTTTPVGTTGPAYTLEELSYQETGKEIVHPAYGWSYKWVNERGFILQPNQQSCPALQPVRIRRAVYRWIVDE